MTVTIPPGLIGNQQPIEIVWERWYSADLQLNLRTRRLDPRFGETVVSLTNIVRTDPPSTLFEVPAEFSKQ